MPTYVLTVAGATKSLLSGSLQIAQTANGIDTLSCAIYSVDASYRPALDAAVVLTEDGTPIFGGVIHAVQESGHGGVGQTPIVSKIDCQDYSCYADRRFVKATIPTGNLKAALTYLVTNYLTTYGVTLDAGQVNGPTLPELTYDYQKLTEVLNNLAAMSGYVWDISYTKVLSMKTVGSTTAPFNLAAGDGKEIGDITVEPTREDFYANRVIVIGGSDTQIQYTDPFTGDGATTTFTLTRVPSPKSINSFYGYVMYNDGSDGGHAEGISDVPAAAVWLVNSDFASITRQTGAPTAGTAITVQYNGLLSAAAQANDAGEQAAVGLWEVVVKVDEALSNTALQSIASGELSRRTASTKIVQYRTYETGLAVGQTQGIVIPLRNLNATAFITDITISDPGRSDNKLLKTVKATTSGVYQPGGWRDTYKQWMQTGKGSGASTVPSSVSFGGGDEPAPPNRSVQFNKLGDFGGSADVLEDYNDSGSVYGVHSAPARIAIVRDNQGDTGPGPTAPSFTWLALSNRQVGSTAALTISESNNATWWIESEKDMVVDSAKKGVQLNAFQNIGLTAGDGNSTSTGILTDNTWVRLAPGGGLDALWGASRLLDANHRVDDAYTVTAGVPPDFLLLHHSTSNHTFTLPGTGSTGMSVGGSDRAYRRIIAAKNGYAGGSLTLSSTSGIDGGASVTLGSGQSALAFSFIGTSTSTAANQWYTISGSAGTISTSTGVSPAGNTNDIQYNNAGSFGAEDAFAYDPTANHFFLTTDHTNYGTGAIFSAYTVGSTATGNISLFDIEPGLDGTVIAASCHDAYGFYLNPVFRPAAAGTHPLFAGAYLDHSNMSSGSGAAVTEASTLFVNGAPSFGTGNHALYVATTGAFSIVEGTLHVPGMMRFGTHSTAPATTVTGWLTVQDSAGNPRKIAVVTT